jgi:hypothetical protein
MPSRRPRRHSSKVAQHMLPSQSASTTAVGGQRGAKPAQRGVDDAGGAGEQQAEIDGTDLAADEERVDNFADDIIAAADEFTLERCEKTRSCRDRRMLRSAGCPANTSPRAKTAATTLTMLSMHRRIAVIAARIGDVLDRSSTTLTTSEIAPAVNRTRSSDAAGGPQSLGRVSNGLQCPAERVGRGPRRRCAPPQGERRAGRTANLFVLRSPSGASRSMTLFNGF